MCRWQHACVALLSTSMRLLVQRSASADSRPILQPCVGKASAVQQGRIQCSPTGGRGAAAAAQPACSVPTYQPDHGQHGEWQETLQATLHLLAGLDLVLATQLPLLGSWTHPHRPVIPAIVWFSLTDALQVLIRHYKERANAAALSGPRQRTCKRGKGKGWGPGRNEKVHEDAAQMRALPLAGINTGCEGQLGG